MNQRRFHSDTPPACTVKSGKKLSAAATPPTDALHDAMLVTVPDDLPDSPDKRIDRKTMMSARTYREVKKILRSHPMISRTYVILYAYVSGATLVLCACIGYAQTQTLDQLDDNTFFPARFSATSFMRVHVVADVIPSEHSSFEAARCLDLVRRTFPGRIDVIRDHNYHSILLDARYDPASANPSLLFMRSSANLLVTTPEITAM